MRLKREKYTLHICSEILIFNVENEYVIHGYQYGLRELRQNINLTDDISGLSDLKVKNNMTGEWEDLPAIATPSNDRES